MKSSEIRSVAWSRATSAETRQAAGIFADDIIATGFKPPGVTESAVCPFTDSLVTALAASPGGP